jgi:hypothetical protein
MPADLRCETLVKFMQAPVKAEVTGMEKLHNTEFHNVYSYNIVRMINVIH